MKAGFLLSLVLLSMGLLSCNNSKKGNWSEADKRKFHQEMSKVKELDNFKENKKDFIDCYFQKVEATYSSFFEADIDEEGLTVLAEDCVREVFSNGSVKGNWSEIDKQKFYSELENIPELVEFGGYKEKWIECYLKKCEAQFSSFYEANTQTGEGEEMMIQFATDCTNELDNLL